MKTSLNPNREGGGFIQHVSSSFQKRVHIKQYEQNHGVEDAHVG